MYQIVKGSIPKKNRDFVAPERNNKCGIEWTKEVQAPHAFYFFSEEAGYIWDLIDSKRSVEEIVNELVKIFSAPRKQVYEDVCEFLRLCWNRELIRF